MELALDNGEVFPQHPSPVPESLSNEPFGVELEKVEGKHRDLDLVLHGIPPLPGGQELEGLDALIFPVRTQDLTVEHEGFNFLAEALLEPGDDVGNLMVLSSWILLKIFTVLSLWAWIWTSSPLYFHSHMKRQI